MIWRSNYFNQKQQLERFCRAKLTSTLIIACPVWNPYLVKHIHSIESIQCRATRLICGSHNSYYTERLTEVNWSTLELRRKYLCLVQLYKIIHGYSDIDYTTYVDLTGPTRARRNHDFKIRPRAARTNFF